MQPQAHQRQAIFINSAPLMAGILQAIAEQAGQDESQAKPVQIKSFDESSVTGDLENPSETHADPLTNAPIGYDLAQRHPTEDIALYVRESRSSKPHFVIVGGGVLIGSEDPVDDFELIRRLKPEYVHKYLNGQMGLPKSDDLPKRYIGVYRNITDGDGETRQILWSIHNTDALMLVWQKRFVGLDGQQVLQKIRDSFVEAYDGILTADTREEFPNEMPNIFM